MALTDTVRRTAAGTAAIVATLTVRKLLHSSWRKATRREPPDPANPRSGVGEAILWTAISAAAIAATQLIVRRSVESSLT
jgi:hypothetical protein